MADCLLVQRRIAANRIAIRKEGLSADMFDVLRSKIADDRKLLDGFLVELFNEMCWHNPKLLADDKAGGTSWEDTSGVFDSTQEPSPPR